MQKVVIASDHAGFELKQKMIKVLTQLGFEPVDLGPANEERTDYPDYADKVCRQIPQGSKAMGILICGSGQGVAMRANKYKHIRAALCWNTEVAQLAREHNDANVLCMGARIVDEKTAMAIMATFFKTEFAGGRHEGRVAKLSAPTLEVMNKTPGDNS